jgi:Protein of unknown function (DUF992)
MHRVMSVLAALALIAVASFPAPTMAQTSLVKVGTLTCDISGGIGLIITSRKSVTCMYTPAQPGPREVYRGSITKFGLDIGATAGGGMIWAVYAPTSLSFGALAGNYGGASGEATIGIGAGANVLIGGSNHTVTLQPVSVQGQAGLNLAVGVAGLDLQASR